MRECPTRRELGLLAGFVAVVFWMHGCAKNESEPAQRAESADAPNQPQPEDVVHREGEPPITYVDEDDAEMQAAMKTAQNSVEDFIAVLKSPRTNQSGFSVKVGIRDGEHSEAMWILPVEFDGKKFSGILNNEPDQVATVKLGDRLESPADEILDWMYVENGKLVGGYTLRVLRNRMTEEERTELDNSVPFVID